MYATKQPLRAATAALIAAGFGVTATAQAVQFEAHGHLDHRFSILDTQTGFLANNNDRARASDGQDGAEINDDADDNFGELKYRIWFEAASDDDTVKGVYAFEVGGINFGAPGGLGAGTGGAFSGDGVNVETRWAYTDFAVPTANAHRVRVGLQPWSINRHLWNETALGVQLSGPINERTGYKLTWGRGQEEFPRSAGGGFNDLDGFSAHLMFNPREGHDIELLGLFQINNQDNVTPTTVLAQDYEVKQAFSSSKFDIYTFGGVGQHKFGTFNLDWTGLYQTGNIDNVAFSEADAVNTGAGANFTGDADLSAWFGRLDISRNFGGTNLKYTFWYASGDDNPNDGDFDAFLATDVDMSESAIFFEGKPTSDDFFVETPYIFDKGLIFHKLEASRQTTPKLKLTGSLAYLQLAEELNYVDDSANAQSQDSLGFELGGKAEYMLYKNLKLTGQAAYLISDDAMDFFETGSGVARDGSADEDILGIYARIEYRY